MPARQNKYFRVIPAYTEGLYCTMVSHFTTLLSQQVSVPSAVSLSVTFHTVKAQSLMADLLVKFCATCTRLLQKNHKNVCTSNTSTNELFYTMSINGCVGDRHVENITHSSMKNHRSITSLSVNKSLRTVCSCQSSLGDSIQNTG